MNSNARATKNDRLVVASYAMLESTIARIRRLSNETGVPQARIVERILLKGLDEWEKKEE